MGKKWRQKSQFRLDFSVLCTKMTIYNGYIKARYSMAKNKRNMHLKVNVMQFKANNQFDMNDIIIHACNKYAPQDSTLLDG